MAAAMRHERSNRSSSATTVTQLLRGISAADCRSHKPVDVRSSRTPATTSARQITLPLKLTRWKRLFEEQEGKARHLVAAPLLYFFVPFDFR